MSRGIDPPHLLSVVIPTLDEAAAIGATPEVLSKVGGRIEVQDDRKS